jgi:anti-sigma B factor antagonist
MSLKVGIRKTDDITLLDLEGRLWVQEGPLHTQVRSLLEGGCRFLILNLEKVDYIDSSGLGQLVSIWTSVRSLGGNVNLLRPTDRVKRLLRTTSLYVVFDVFEDEKLPCVATGRRNRRYNGAANQLLESLAGARCDR